MISIERRSPTQTFFLVLIIGLLNTITPFSIDMYLPAFPQIAAELHTDISHVALSVSTYFLGFAIGQILFGPLLDRFGRKRPLLTGMCLYMIASIGCITCKSIDTFLWMRFIQALSGCVASVAAMAMVRDFFPAQQSARIISLLVLILGASPLLAPTTGSLVVVAWGWHYVFVLLAVITGILVLVVAIVLPEGHTPDVTISLKPKPILSGFMEVISKPGFYIYALAGTFSFSGLFVYVADSPAVFMDYFQLSARQYGLVFAILSVGFIGGSQLNHFLSRKFRSDVILKTTVICQVFLSIIFLAGSINEWYGFASVMFFLFVLLLCAGLGYPNAAAMALSPFSRNVGSASALLGFIQIGIGGLISSGVGLVHLKGSLTIALIMTFTAMVAWVILWVGSRRIPAGTH